MTLSYYQTPDLQLAASIITSGIELEKFRRHHNGRVFLVFKDTPQLQQMIRQYWNRSLLIDARTVLIEFRSLKRRIIDLNHG